jgi:hypothetical protein
MNVYELRETVVGDMPWNRNLLDDPPMDVKVYPTGKVGLT